MDLVNDRRKVDAKKRAQRITAGAVGGGGFVGLANFIVAFWGSHWSPEQTAGVVGLISWSGTWISVCIWDIRAIILTSLQRRILDKDV